MSDYKPTQEQIDFAMHVWETQIKHFVYNPHELRQAHLGLFGYVATTPQQARTRINAYFLYQYKGVDETQTTLPQSGESQAVGTSENLSAQTHQEDVTISESSLSENSETDTQEVTDAEVLQALKPKNKKQRKTKKDNE